MNSRGLVFVFVLTSLMVGTTNVAKAGFGPYYSIENGTPTQDGSGVGPTYTVPFTGSLAIPANSTIVGNTLSMKGTGGTFAGGQTFTYLRTTGGVDIYTVTGSVSGVTAGTYTAKGSVSFTPPGSTTPTTFSCTTAAFNVP